MEEDLGNHQGCAPHDHKAPKVVILEHPVVIFSMNMNDREMMIFN